MRRTCWLTARAWATLKNNDGYYYFDRGGPIGPVKAKPGGVFRMKSMFAVSVLTVLVALPSAAFADAPAMQTVLSSSGRVLYHGSPEGARGRAAVVCPEAENLSGPRCGDDERNCVDALPIGICVRRGFLYKLTLCTDPNASLHQGHAFSWSRTGSLPPSLSLQTPPNPSTVPDATSTAYVGGTQFVGPIDGDDGKHYGFLSAPFCGSFSIANIDLCPTTSTHASCAGSFPVNFRTLDVDQSKPMPYFITDGGLPDAKTGQFYSVPLQGEGGIGDYVFNVISGSLPPGLGLSSAGTVSGFPQSAGIYTFTVQLSENPTNPIFLPPEGCLQAPPCSAETDIREFTLIVSAVETSTTTLKGEGTTTTLKGEGTTTTLKGEGTTTTLKGEGTTTTLRGGGTTTTLNGGGSTTTTVVPPPPSSTTTTWPPSCLGRCGLPVSAGPDPLASDCLYILRAAVKLESCALCVCDVDSSCAILATDALRCLNKAVHNPVDLFCDECVQ